MSLGRASADTVKEKPRGIRSGLTEDLIEDRMRQRTDTVTRDWIVQLWAKESQRLTVKPDARESRGRPTLRACRERPTLETI